MGKVISFVGFSDDGLVWCFFVKELGDWIRVVLFLLVVSRSGLIDYVKFGLVSFCG